jgi:hypothetical protein
MSIRSMKEVEEFFKERFSQIMSLREAGQKEYAHDRGNAFANFERLAGDLDLDRQQILWVYAMKHRDGIAAYLKGHTSQREDVRGRIQDLIVYLFLLWAMIEDDRHTRAADCPDD